MKYSTKIKLTECIIILLSFFCFFYITINRYVYLGILLLMAIIPSVIFKPEKRKERFHTDITLIIIICILFYYFITNFLGFFFGFYYTSYSRSFFGIVTNITTALIVIGSIEVLRENLIKNNFYHKSIIYITPLIGIMLEMPSLINLRMYTSRLDIFNAILSLILPCILKHILLSYITYKSDKKCSLIYQLLIIIPKYLLPVFPNLGDFFEIIAQVLLPIVTGLVIANVTNVKTEKIKNSRKLKNNKILFTACNIFIAVNVCIMLYLTSNKFRFYSLAIGSGSMQGTINKGDIVIIDKKKKEIKKGDIIAFQELGKVVVHRVIEVEQDKNHFRTKGDANESEDAWVVNNNDVVGKVVMNIKWLGWPTVSLSELIKNR